MDYIGSDQFNNESLKKLELAKKYEKNNKDRVVKRAYKDPGVCIMDYNMSLLNKTMMIKRDPHDYYAALRDTYITGQKHCCKKSLDELTPIALKDMMIPKIHTGHYLICQTVTRCQCFICIRCLIQDINGDVENLALHNFQIDLADDPNETLPIGTIMIIKEPYLQFEPTPAGTGVGIRCDSLSDVIFVERFDERLKTLAPDWFLNISPSFDDVKKNGDELYKKGEFRAALQLYNHAAKISQDALASLSLSDTYLQLNRFFEAYPEAKKAYESQSNDNDGAKALLNMGKAAYGMRDWNLALEHFTTVANQYPNNTLAPLEIEKTKSRIEESSNRKYDLQSMYRQFSMGIRFFDVADYVGPVKVADVEGKGKGLITTEDVGKSTLLMVSKAFSYTDTRLPSCGLSKISARSSNLITNMTDVQSQVINVIKTMHVLKDNPNRSSELYSLFAGELDREETIPNGIIDTGRIEQICSFNSVDTQNIFAVEKATDLVQDYSCLATGLWILPSFINHSCIANSFRIFYGDAVMIYSLKDIKAGEEITCSYVNPLSSYQTRLEVMRKFRFNCECKLCKEDCCNEQRVKLCKELDEIRYWMFSDIKRALKTGISIVDKIRKTYKVQNSRKLELVIPVLFLGDLYRNNNDVPKALHYFKEARELLSEFQYVLFPHIHLKITECLMKTGEKANARKCLQRAYKENGLKLGFDSIEFFKHVYLNILNILDISDLI